MSNSNKINFQQQFSFVIVFVWIISIGMVSYLSLTPRIEFPLEFWSADKVYHAISYLWLSFLPFFVFERVKMALAGALSVTILGFGLEFFQAFVPGRFFSIADMIANSSGATIGIFFGRYLRSYSEIRLRS